MPAGMADTSHDPRMQENATSAKRRLDALAKASSTTVDSIYDHMYGELKSIKFMSVDIPTDSSYQFQLLDVDGVVVYNNATVSDVPGNQPVWVNLTVNEVLQLCGMYKGRWTWTTPRIITALDYQTLFIFE